MKTVSAAGGILFNKGKNTELDPFVLLIFRRGKWDLPKGKKERGESIRQCAVREVSEETGIPGPDILVEIGKTYHEYRRGGENIGKTTYWYAMHSEMEQSFEADADEGIEKVKWVPVEEALNRVAFENLADILNKFIRWYRGEFDGN